MEKWNWTVTKKLKTDKDNEEYIFIFKYSKI